MRTIKILAISIMAFMLFACSKLASLGPTYRSYITSYLDPQEIYQGQMKVFSEEELAKLNSTKTDLINIHVGFIKNEKYMFSSSRIDARKNYIYDSLCLANNDMTFNHTGGGFMTEVIITPTKSYDIVCNQDFDAGHSAGVSLNDYYRILYISAKEFIDNKYGAKSDGSISECEYQENLNEFNSKEHPLMGAIGAIFGSNTLPETAGDYTFTITYKDSKGKTLSVTTEPVTLPARG